MRKNTIVVLRKQMQYRAPGVDHAKLIDARDVKITILKRDHAKLTAERDAQLSRLKRTNARIIAEHNAQISSLQRDHARVVASRDAQVSKLKRAHVRRIAERELKILRLEQQREHSDIEVCDDHCTQYPILHNPDLSVDESEEEELWHQRQKHRKRES